MTLFNASDILQWFSLWESELDISEATIRFTSLEDALSAVSCYEEKTSTKFSAYKATKNFGHHSDSSYGFGRKIHFEENSTPKVPFDGIPFVELGLKILDCHRGKDRHLAFKQRAQEIPKERPHKKKKGLKKINCPAQLIMREIMIFPEFEVKANKRWLRTTSSKRLKVAIGAGTAQGRNVIIVNFPTSSDHHTECITQTEKAEQVIDGRILRYIYELVRAGVESVDDVQQHLEYYIKHELFSENNPPTHLDKEFALRKRDLKKLVHQAKRQSRLSDLIRVEKQVIHRPKAVEEDLEEIYIEESEIYEPLLGMDDNLEEEHRILDFDLFVVKEDEQPDGNSDNYQDVQQCYSDGDRCRDLLKEIGDLTYCVTQNGSVMRNLSAGLEFLLKNLKESVDENSVIQMNCQTGVKRTLLSGPDEEPTEKPSNKMTVISSNSYETPYSIFSDTSQKKRVSFVLQSGTSLLN